jgi:hypothetical protein
MGPGGRGEEEANVGDFDKSDVNKARIGCHDEGVVTCVALTP